MTQFIKTVLWTFALSFLAILMMIWLMPVEPTPSDPFMHRIGGIP